MHCCLISPPFSRSRGRSVPRASRARCCAAASSAAELPRRPRASRAMVFAQSASHGLGGGLLSCSTIARFAKTDATAALTFLFAAPSTGSRPLRTKSRMLKTAYRFVWKMNRFARYRAQQRPRGPPPSPPRSPKTCLMKEAPRSEPLKLSALVGCVRKSRQRSITGNSCSLGHSLSLTKTTSVSHFRNSAQVPLVFSFATRASRYETSLASICKFSATCLLNSKIFANIGSCFPSGNVSGVIRGNMLDSGGGGAAGAAAALPPSPPAFWMMNCLIWSMFPLWICSREQNDSATSIGFWPLLYGSLLMPWAGPMSTSNTKS
mmetsp:Transcript_117823/g.334037  ORF Transcript_117823/g.334037 Transcript_117823/m.334037 type:complete len:320 (+) Transcript_117823:281-1240(+)